MYDSIIVNVRDLPLSNSSKQDLIDIDNSEDIHFQTKDLDSVLEYYTIKDAKLVYLGKFANEKYTGAIRFVTVSKSKKRYQFLALIYKDDVLLIEEDK